MERVWDGLLSRACVGRALAEYLRSKYEGGVVPLFAALPVAVVFPVLVELFIFLDEFFERLRGMLDKLIASNQLDDTYFESIPQGLVLVCVNTVGELTQIRGRRLAVVSRVINDLMENLTKFDIHALFGQSCRGSLPGWNEVPGL